MIASVEARGPVTIALEDHVTHVRLVAMLGAEVLCDHTADTEREARAYAEDSIRRALWPLESVP